MMDIRFPQSEEATLAFQFEQGTIYTTVFPILARGDIFNAMNPVVHIQLNSLGHLIPELTRSTFWWSLGPLTNTVVTVPPGERTDSPHGIDL